MNTTIFIVSGVVSVATTLLLILYIYMVSPSTRAELKIGKMMGFVFGIYLTLNIFYYFNLIPPVPLALEHGIVAHNIEKDNSDYTVTYETDEWYIFWRVHRNKYAYQPDEPVYIFSSIFAPTDLKKTVSHRWKWLDPNTNEWEVMDDISFEITGGRDNGYRGFTFKNNLIVGKWQVEIITEEALVIGNINFEIETGSFTQPQRLVTKKF